MGDQIWISYQDSVYDITEFVKNHPGGSEKLMMAAGGSIDHFWEMYPFHKADAVKQLLVPYLIGKLHPDDMLKEEDKLDFTDLHNDGVKRSPDLIMHQKFPYCAETNKKYLSDHFLTPTDQMYIRNHNSVPEFDEDFEQEFELKIGLYKGDEDLFKSYTLDQLRNMNQVDVTTSIACAGNRRKHTRFVYPTVKGLDWDIGAIGNNTYRGVLVRDLLLDMGYSLDELKGKHLVATGLDADF